MNTLRILFACLYFGALTAVAGPVDINTADAAALSQNLTGIGARTAQAIVAYRKANGPFRSVDELQLVKGIGPATVARNRANLRVGKVVDKPRGKQGAGGR